MKRFLLGTLIGLFIGWLTVPVVKASWYKIPFQELDDDAPHTYKGFLNQILASMKQMNQHLENIENNTKAVKDKLHA